VKKMKQTYTKYKEEELRGFGPLANYAYRATAASWPQNKAK
jgi:hypothetical protein